jgi:hypothetical protein
MRKRVENNDLVIPELVPTTYSSASSSTLPTSNKVAFSRRKKPHNKLLRNIFKCLLFLFASWLLLLVAILLWLYHQSTTSKKNAMVSPSVVFSRTRRDTAVNASPSSPPMCTEKQMSGISRQLNPEHLGCLEKPWKRECPVTAATKCYNQSWLTTYYSKNEVEHSFLAITLGCNGYNAVDLLRLGTFDPSIDVSVWKNASASVFKNTILDSTSACGRDDANHQVYIPPGSSPRREGQVYCVEAEQALVEAINKTNQLVSYDWKGLHIVYNPPISNHRESLDCFMERHIAGNNSKIINVLEVENGYEYEAMAWGMQTLKRTEYILFKYDWKGSWSLYGRTIEATVHSLDGIGLTCYWAGMGRLWRITSCFYKEYDERGKYWSHIACANRILAPALVEEMEKLFERTIQE